MRWNTGTIDEVDGIGVHGHPSHHGGGALHGSARGTAAELAPRATMLSDPERSDDVGARGRSDDPPSRAQRKAVRA